MDYKTHNAAAWNKLVAGGTKFAAVAVDDELVNPLAVLDGRGWLPASVFGLSVLCLAAGGGWQSILYAAAGANVTVVDTSAEMLKIDEREAAKRGFRLRVLEASMDDLAALGDGVFDIVHQPVSTCYVPDIARVYREIARVTRPSGIYISQHKQPTSLQITHRTGQGQYIVGLEYYRNSALPDVTDDSYREPGTVEYLHRWEELVGELCRAGFVLEDLSEPYRADPAAPVGQVGHRGRYIPPYVRIKARRNAALSSESPRVWLPGGV